MDNKNVFATNLRRYMDMNGKSRRDVCEAIDVNYSTFTDWVKGKKYPRIDKVEKLAEYFGISKSDLIEEHAKEDNEMPTTHELPDVSQEAFQHQSPELHENIKTYRIQKNMTQDELAKRMGYTDRSSIAKVEKGAVDLPISKIIQFAEIFDVEPGELLGWVNVSDDEKNIGMIADVVSRMSSDHTFFNFIKSVYNLSSSQIKDFTKVLEIFLKNS